MDKKFWAILGIIAVFVVGAIWVSNKNAGAPANHGQPTNHVEGHGKDHVTLVEYGDYECPFCGQYFPIVKQVVDAYSPYITFQFRNFPLTSLHPNAFAAAQAAEAAALQGKFWQMHDLLYQNQTIWSTSSNAETYFVQYAQQLGLNVNKFKQDLVSDKINNLIDADEAAGNKLNINATPTFILDGKQVQPKENASDFQRLINAEITQKTGKPAPNVNLSSAASNSSTSNTAPQSKQ